MNITGHDKIEFILNSIDDLPEDRAKELLREMWSDALDKCSDEDIDAEYLRQGGLEG